MSLTAGGPSADASGMQDDAPSSDLRQRLELVGLSYADWELESEALRRAADGSAGSGLVDAHNLVRAGEIADAIDAELVSLGEVSADIVDGETAGQVQGVRDRLVALRDEIRRAARKMHGLA